MGDNSERGDVPGEVASRTESADGEARDGGGDSRSLTRGGTVVIGDPFTEV